MVYDKYIPYEIMQKIIYCLPAKSVVAFKAVSRYFNAFISDPNFISTYISLHPDPSWFLFEQTLIKSRNYRFPIELTFNKPPNLSTISVDIHKLGLYYPRLVNPTLVSSSGELLLVVPKMRPMSQSSQSGYHFFVINAITKEWVALPKPGFGFDHTNLGLIAQIDRENRVFREFRVAAYLPSTPEDMPSVLCFSSETAQWEMKLINYMIEDYIWGNDGGNFEFEGKLIWYDVNVGLIIWDDPFSTEEEIHCRLIMLPIQFVRGNEGQVDDERVINISDGFIQFLRHSYVTFIVNVWRLQNLGDESWINLYSLNLTQILPNCSGQKPVLCHPFEYGVAIFKSPLLLMSMDLRTPKVRNVQTILPRMNMRLFSVLLPSWPRCFTPIMHGRFLQVHGNNSFAQRRYENAIYFYTQSIKYTENVRVYMLRAKTYNKLHRTHQANQDFLKAIEIDSQFYYAFRMKELAGLTRG